MEFLNVFYANIYSYNFVGAVESQKIHISFKNGQRDKSGVRFLGEDGHLGRGCETHSDSNEEQCDY